MYIHNNISVCEKRGGEGEGGREREGGEVNGIIAELKSNQNDVIIVCRVGWMEG